MVYVIQVCWHIPLLCVQFCSENKFEKLVHLVGFIISLYFTILLLLLYIYPYIITQGESFARGPKLLSVKNYVIEIMTWKFIYTYRERCKTGPAHNRCWNWSPITSKHTWMHFSKFWNTFPKCVEVDGLNLLAYSVFELFDCAGVYFCTLCPSMGPTKKEVGRR